MGADVTARWAKLGLAATLAVWAGIAAAQSPVCLDLQSQYLVLLRQTDSGNRGQRLLDMDKIGRDLANAQAAARRGNCGRFLFFGPNPSPQCPAIMGAIGRLQRQLAQMRGQQGFGFFARSPEFEKARLRDWLLQYGCDVPEAGGLRTICVRKCDGYYFPINFSANRQRVATDAAVCQSMYAEDGQAELFTHANSGDVADAISTAGERYGEQPYAFTYRANFSRVCSAELKDGIAALGARYWGAVPRGAGTSRLRPPMPQLRPLDRQEDPETVANRAGGLSPTKPLVADETEPVAADEPTAATALPGPVRQVGPAYYAELFDPAGLVGRDPPAPSAGFSLVGSAFAAEPAPVSRSQGERH